MIKAPVGAGDIHPDIQSMSVTLPSLYILNKVQLRTPISTNILDGE
jgi:hypothetical protein